MMVIGKMVFIKKEYYIIKMEKKNMKDILIDV